MNSLFYELIRVAIGTQDMLSRQPNAGEWDELYRIAQEQSLVGLCFAGVQGMCNSDEENYCGMKEMQYLTWMGVSAQIQVRNHIVDKQCMELCEKLAADGFRSCVLKGQGTARIYDNLADLRQSGDIDVWVMPRDVRTVKQSRRLINEYVHRHFPKEEGAFVHIGFPVFDDTEVEMHYVPTMDGCPWVDRRLIRMFEDRQDACFENLNEFGFAVPESMVNVLFNLHHVKRHFIISGIGMRHVLDLYFIFKSWNEGLASVSGWASRQELERMIKVLRLRRFLSGMIWVMNEVLGDVPADFGVEADERLGRFILREIMLGGNFGHHDERLAGVDNMGFWQRWMRYMSVSLVRAMYFPADVFWAYVFRARVGLWRRTGIEF